MNNDKDLFRQALQRQNERAAKMKMPEDMEQRVMKSLTPRPLQAERGLKSKRFFLSWRAVGSGLIAASILLLLVINIGKNTTDDRHPLAQQSIRPNNPQPAAQSIIAEKKEETMAVVQPKEKPVKKQRPVQIDKEQQLAKAETPSPTKAVKLFTTADSLYYYLTQLENQMGECRDSTCLAELSNLMRADERIKGLVHKIIHKQVETAYKEEYLVDTTIHYIPL